MEKRILFVILPYVIKDKKYKLRSFVAFPYGVLSIISYVKNNIDCDFQLLDGNLVEDYYSQLEKVIHEYQPEYIAVSMMFDNSYKYLEKTLDVAKGTGRNIKTLLGGAAVTYAYGEIIKDQNNLDAICVGEGEKPFLSLIKSGDFQSNAWVTKKSWSQKIEPQRDVVSSLDEVISIDYSVIDVSQYNDIEEAFSPFNKGGDKKQFFIVSSRGCPFSCKFCMNSLNDDKSVRLASVNAIISHVKTLVEEYQMTVLTFYDDQILFSKSRAKELFKALIPFKLRIEMPNGVGITFIDEELASYMKEAGVDSLYVAIESGSDYVLKNIMNKPLSLKIVREKINILKKYNFWLLGYFVVGMPGETDDHRRETIGFIKELGLDWCSFTVATPVRGSLLYLECLEKGYIDNESVRIGQYEWVNGKINTPEYSSDYIEKQTYLMNLEINFVSNYRMRIGDYKLAMKEFYLVKEKHPYHLFAEYYYYKAKMLSSETWAEYAEYFKLS